MGERGADAIRSLPRWERRSEPQACGAFRAGRPSVQCRSHHRSIRAFLAPSSSRLKLTSLAQLMFYIRTADRLVRTAPWLDKFEGGVEVRLPFTPRLTMTDHVVRLCRSCAESSSTTSWASAPTSTRRWTSSSARTRTSGRRRSSIPSSARLSSSSSTPYVSLPLVCYGMLTTNVDRMNAHLRLR